MKITLSNNDEIEILAVNLAGNTFDWKRIEGYKGACVSSAEFEGFETMEETIKSALEKELVEETE